MTMTTVHSFAKTIHSSSWSQCLASTTVSCFDHPPALFNHFPLMAATDHAYGRPKGGGKICLRDSHDSLIYSLIPQEAEILIALQAHPEKLM
jgi:hypothetical protein